MLRQIGNAALQRHWRGGWRPLQILLGLLLLSCAACNGPQDPPQAAKSAPVASPLPAPVTRPDVLVVMTDDLDQDLFDLMLDQGLLPNIEREVLRPGLRFRNSFVSDPVCCPSRATFLTGQYVKNHGILGVTKGAAYWYFSEDNREDHALPVIVQKAGYYTGHVGKYLNGYGMFSKKEHLPKGYDEWYGLLDPSTYDMYDFELNMSRGGKTEIVEFKQGNRSHYQTDVLGDYALQFLDAASQSGKPFYLTLKPVAPHVETKSFTDSGKLGYRSLFRENIRPAKRDECLLRGIVPEYRAAGGGPRCALVLPDSLAVLQRKPSFNHMDDGKPERLRKVVQPLDTEDLRNLARQHRMRMVAMLAVDDLVGRVTESLRQRGRLDNTLLIFTSDNGYFQGEHGLDSKLLPYEESIRVPLIIRPPHGKQARSVSQIALNNDLAPTIADYAGAVVERPVDLYDGRSLRGLLEHGEALSRKQFMVEHFVEAGALELAQEHPGFARLEKSVIDIAEKFAGFEFGSLANLSYPAYKAVRRIDSDSNLLYVQWYSNVLNTEEWNTDFEELYDLKKDRYQMSNLINETPPAYIETLQLMRSDMEAFKRCHAENCQEIENR